MSNQNLNNIPTNYNKNNNDFLNKKREINDSNQNTTSKLIFPHSIQEKNQIEFNLCNKCNLKTDLSNAFLCQKCDKIYCKNCANFNNYNNNNFICFDCSKENKIVCDKCQKEKNDLLKFSKIDEIIKYLKEKIYIIWNMKK